MSWPVVAFSDVLEDVTGGNEKTKQGDYATMGAYPIVDQGQSLVGGYTDDPASLCKTEEPVIVFGDHTKSLKYIDFPFCLGADGTKVLKPKLDANTKYLYYALQNIHIPEAGYSRHFKYLKAGKIPLPPLDAQNRIAGILDQADALRRLRARALDKLNSLGQAIFHEMFGAEAKASISTKAQKIGDFCDVSSGSTPSRKGDGYYEGTIPWVKTGEVNGRTILQTEEKVTEAGRDSARLKTYPIGTVLIAMYGQGKTRGQVGILGIAATTNQACAALVCKEDILPEFLFYQLRSSYERLREQGRGGNQPNLNAGMVKEFPIFVPDLERQAEFVILVQSAEFQAKRNIASLLKLETLFSSVQNRAFRGDL